MAAGEPGLERRNGLVIVVWNGGLFRVLRESRLCRLGAFFKDECQIVSRLGRRLRKSAAIIGPKGLTQRRTVS
jgi:hypothetical protein